MRRRLPRSRSAALAAAALAALPVLGAACGGGSDARLSRRALVAEADAVCAEGLRDAERLRRRAVPGARGEAAATEVDATLEVLRRQIDAFEDLRGPAATDELLEQAVTELEEAADGLDELRRLVVDRRLTIDEAIDGAPGLVDRINLASARANDALVDLGFLGCVALPPG